MNAHRNLGVTSDRLAVAMRRLSSGLRINSAADDAAGLGISEKMRGQIRGLEQANRNVQDGMSLLQVMDGVLSEVTSILHRARDIAVQWNNGIYDFDDRMTMRAELFALSDEIGRIEQTTEFNGIKLLQDASIAITLQIGANNNEIMTVSLVDLMGGTVGNLVRLNTFFALPFLDADIAGFDFHINDVSAARARIGAAQNRLEHTLASNQTYLENLTGAESRIRDADMAVEISTLTRLQILQQSGTMALLFANQTPRRITDLLAPGGG